LGRGKLDKNHLNIKLISKIHLSQRQLIRHFQFENAGLIERENKMNENQANEPLTQEEINGLHVAAMACAGLVCAVGLALLLGDWITNESPIKNPHPFGQAPSVHILTLR
jgi:hypothetical protein